MKLKRLTATNLKGLSFTLELDALTMLVGANFAGKSARTDAIRLLFLGHLPELGKTGRATFGLCSGKEMTVEGEFEGCGIFQRRWYLKGDAVKTETIGTLGPDWNDEQGAVMLDSATYFGLGERDRVAYVFANVPGLGADFDPDTVLEEIHRDLRGVEGLRTDAVERFLNVLEADRPKSFAWTPQTLLDFVATHAKADAQSARATAIVMEKTAQGLAHLRAQETVETSPGAIDAEIGAKKSEIAELQTAKARASQAFESQRAIDRRRKQLASDLEGSKVALNRRAEAHVAIEAIEKELAKLPAGTTKELDALRAEEREATIALAHHRAEKNQAETAIVLNEREGAKLAKIEKCPTCGSVGTAWRDSEIASINATIAGLTTKVGVLDDHILRLVAHVERLGARMKVLASAASVRTVKEGELAMRKTTLASAERLLGAADAKVAELAALPKEDPELAAKLDAAQTALNVANDALFALEGKRRATEGRAHDLKRLAEAEKNRDDAREDEAVAKAARSIVESVQAGHVARAFHPLLATANSFFPDVLLTPLAYNDGEIGTWRDGTWVSHHTFSGTEKALTYAAIQAALASRSPVRIMLLDELGRLDDVNAVRLLGGVAAAVERGKIDQFVGIDTGRGLLYDNEARALGVGFSMQAIDRP